MPPPTKRKIRVAIRCDFCDDYGAQCEFIAKDGTGLQLHKWKVHHIGHRLRHLVPTNVCIYCSRIFGHRISVFRHLELREVKGTCEHTVGGHSLQFVDNVIQPCLLECEPCGLKFQQLEDLLDRLRIKHCS